jgi:hypothetical protein
MKKSELKVGEEYAIGSSSRYDRFYASHVKVLDLNGEGKGPYGSKTKGILVEFVEDSAGYPYSGRKTGDKEILQSARNVRGLWSEYAESRRVAVERERVRKAEEDRQDRLAEDAVIKLRRLGFEADTGRFSHAPIHWTGKVFSIDVDEMKRLVDRIS